MQKSVVVCLDLEGVLVPEIWINVALKTGIDDLKITTREMPDYDKLMRQRLNILDLYRRRHFRGDPPIPVPLPRSSPEQTARHESAR